MAMDGLKKLADQVAHLFGGKPEDDTRAVGLAPAPVAQPEAYGQDRLVELYHKLDVLEKENDRLRADNLELRAVVALPPVSLAKPRTLTEDMELYREVVRLEKENKRLQQDLDNSCDVVEHLRTRINQAPAQAPIISPDAARRLRIVPIDRLILGELLKPPAGKFYQFMGLPEDAQLVNISQDTGFTTGTVLLLYQSQSFDVVPRGEAISPLQIHATLVSIEKIQQLSDSSLSPEPPQPSPAPDPEATP